MHRLFPSRRCSAIRRSSQPCRGLLSRHRSWGLTLRSVAPARRRRRCFHAAGPTCRFLSVRSRPEVFCSREINRLMRHDAPTVNECDGRSRTLSAAPGVGLRAIRAARRLIVCRDGRCCLGLWLLLQVFGHHHLRRASAPMCWMNRALIVGPCEPLGSLSAHGL